MKKYIRLGVNKIKCLFAGAPKSCYFYRGSRVNCCVFEGNNTVGKNASVKNTYIGYGTYIAQKSIIESCKIGKYCAVGFETLIGGHPIHKVASIHPALYSTKGQYGFTYVKENSFQEYHYADNENHAIVIGNDVWITAGTTKIVQGITIEDGAIVLADAVVTKNVPAYAIVGGIPAKIVGYRFTEEQIKFLQKLKWWQRDEEWIKNHAIYFKDIELLINIIMEEEPELLNC